jgi:hypothetical protein
MKTMPFCRCPHEKRERGRQSATKRQTFCLVFVFFKVTFFLFVCAAWNKGTRVPMGSRLQ